MTGDARERHSRRTSQGADETRLAARAAPPSGDPSGFATIDPNELPPVSVIVPARNADATLPAALESVRGQDYRGALEVIVADGSDTAATLDLLRRCFPEVRVVRNPEGTIPSALNCALRAARHPVVARCDAQVVLPAGYLTRAVGTLLRTGAANVGGRQNPVGSTFFERAVALATSTRLGAGDARHRIGGAQGPADTVYLGVFRRDALDAAGGYDETLLRNEDYELNWRLRERGETVWFDPSLVVDYRPRSTLRALATQYFDYGRWKRVVLARHPRSWRARQLAAPMLLAGLAASAALDAVGALAGAGLIPALTPDAGAALEDVAAVVPRSYVLVLVAVSAWAGVRRRCRAALLLPLVAATIHLAWAVGFFLGAPGRRC